VIRSLVAAGLALVVVAKPSQNFVSAQQSTTASRPAGTVYMCPMHPDVRGGPGEKCPRCSMDLVPASQADYRPYLLDFDIVPKAVRAGRAAVARFVVRNPKTGAAIEHFEPVHERLFHLFIVSRDLEYFAHQHPTLRTKGALDLDFTLPRPGVYEFVGDYLPAGGAPQLQQRVVVTAGYDGPLNITPKLTADLAEKADAGTSVRLALSPPRAGREQLITFELSDAITAAAVGDLEPYLGAAGHLFSASADLTSVFHGHPVEGVSSPSGPSIVFQVLFPRAGSYRLWLQFQRHGHLSTVAFTVPVAANE
jgi:Heavy metal binding domain